MNEEKYFNCFDVWFEALKVMKEQKDNNEPSNEGIMFVKME